MVKWDYEKGLGTAASDSLRGGEPHTPGLEMRTHSQSTRMADPEVNLGHTPAETGEETLGREGTVRPAPKGRAQPDRLGCAPVPRYWLWFPFRFGFTRGSSCCGQSG
jgi:hypothetical protein